MGRGPWPCWARSLVDVIHVPARSGGAIDITQIQAGKDMTHNIDTDIGPLDGICVVDLTLSLAGPLCTQRLGDMGAEIIKIEGPNRPGFTSDAEMCGVRLSGETTCSLSINRNKKSDALDLKSDEGRAQLYDLIRGADVVMRNMSPGADKRLGLDYDRLIVIKLDLIHVSIPGYGDEGPLTGWPGQDLLLQSFSGTMMNAGSKDSLPHPGRFTSSMLPLPIMPAKTCWPGFCNANVRVRAYRPRSCSSKLC